MYYCLAEKILILYENSQKNFDIVNIDLTTLKTLKLVDLSIPVSATTIWNPALKIVRVQLAVALF